MKKRCTATLFSILVLALSSPALAQDEGSPEEGVDSPGAPGAPDEPEPLPPDLPPEAPPPTDEALTPPTEPAGPPTGEGVTLKTRTKLSDTRQTWKDIVVIPRKSFLKRGRVELMPHFSVTLNDNLIQHYALGGEVNYFLTDILSIGVSGMYYFKNVLDQEFYTRYHFGRVPSLNKYIYTVTLNFAYVPIYGKFAVLNDHIMHFEIFATAGVGGSGTEIIPRDYRFKPFTNPFTLTFPVGMGGRLFLTKWMAVQAAFRSYIMLDKYEPSERGGAEGDAEVELAKENAKTDIVNNMMFTVGVSFFFPMDFKYTTFR